MNDIEIREIKARQILDSRGNPTIEVDVVLNDGSFGRASVPSGASTGAFEAVVLRDNDKNDYNGKSVHKAVNNVNTIIRDALINKSFQNQIEIDKTLIELDGTANKSKLGANATLGVSLAIARAVASSSQKPLYEYICHIKSLIKGYTKPPEKPIVLPLPLLNILNGGKHASNNVNIQEFMIAPVSAKSFSTGLQNSVAVYFALKAILKEKGYSTGVGDEGGHTVARFHRRAIGLTEDGRRTGEQIAHGGLLVAVVLIELVDADQQVGGDEVVDFRRCLQVDLVGVVRSEDRRQEQVAERRLAVAPLSDQHRHEEVTLCDVASQPASHHLQHPFVEALAPVRIGRDDAL